MFLIFDTETTGLPQNYDLPVSATDNWPRLVQLAWQLHDDKGKLINQGNRIVRPDGFDIPFNAAKVHGITTAKAKAEGLPLNEVLEEFLGVLEQANYNVGHNIDFDVNIVGCEYYRQQIENPIVEKARIDTVTESIEFCAIPGGKGGGFKYPSLSELHQKLFNTNFDDAHDAAADVDATARCFFELVKLKIIKRHDIVNDEVTQYVSTLAAELAKKDKKTAGEKLGGGQQIIKKSVDASTLTTAPYAHLHCHSQFSVLQATPHLGGLVEKAVENGMPAVALTDHANLYGSFKFLREINNANREVLAYNKKVKKGEEEGPEKPLLIKGIVGCEFNICKQHDDKSQKDDGYQVPILAKHKEGYHNLAKLSSAAFTKGFYYVPRIDRKLLIEHKEGLMAFTGSTYGEIPHLILNVGETQAEEAFKWWHEQFGDDFYVELNRHGLEEEEVVNETLLRFAKKYNVKAIAANNVYYLDKDDSNAHDILLCIKDGEKQSTPIGKGRGFRFGFANQEYYFKSQEEIKQIFHDIPEAIENISEIIDKVEHYTLDHDVLLPKFDIPSEFDTESAYLRHLTYEGAKKRYPEITDEIRERLDFELETIDNTGYPGYFLIVQDFTTKAREMGVSVGPGRGSAAGSAVAYCIGITNVDPIEYDLLFERFLNPDRVSLPDIDIDFDDEGRGDIIDWVVNKYGQNQVAQIITYGSMAAKSAVRDTSRVLDYPLPETDKLAKLLPDMVKMHKLFKYSEKELKEKLNGEQLENARQFLDIAKGKDDRADIIGQARILEGSLRNTGIHACGVIITPTDIKELIPITKSKDDDLYVTQFDNSVVEDAGLLKMDFLGLKTLTIIKDAIKLVKERYGVEIDPDEIPLDDPKTYELYQRGETNGTFQFESPGMQKHLKALKPDQFSDLIAMNALYRPGPLQYIPDFIARKNGKQAITYDVPEMEEFLAETYGITVYQEQVMLLSQKLAGFTKGQADVLRKAMGKKKKAILDQLQPKFIEGCKANGISEEKVKKIWTDWEAFAAYAFNKSHSTCYSVVAFHTAYLKANYPAEYMAAVLTHNMNDIKKVTFFMEECKRMGIPCLGPDVNESDVKFTVNDKKEIRFSLSAIKGVGSTAVEEIVRERKENGPFKNMFDLTKRVNLRTVNKKSLESLVLSGAFDAFKMHRAQYLEVPMGATMNGIEMAVRHGSNFQSMANSSQNTLFGATTIEDTPDPVVQECEPWPILESLKKEREVTGIYLSGHPLDDYKLEIATFVKASLSQIDATKERELTVAGIVTEKRERVSKRGRKFCLFNVEDFSGAYGMALFGTQYVELGDMIQEGRSLLLTGKRTLRYNSEDEYEFKISRVETLEKKKQMMLEGKETAIKRIILSLQLDEITETLIQEIETLVKEHPGNYGLSVKVMDNEMPVPVDFTCRKFRISIDQHVIDSLEKIPEVSYKLN